MKQTRPDLPEGDDGRTVVDMNVEGMPWYNPAPHVPKEERRRMAQEDPVLTKREARYYTWGALKATLLVTGVLSAGIVLFVLFCQFVWFR